MAEDKFIPSYFEVNYHIKDNTVYRNEDSSGECQTFKEKCLKACLTHFTKDNLTNVKRIGHHFKTNGKELRNVITRCCCSQHEKTGITHIIVTHKNTNLNFIVGGDCFKKLFADAEDVDTILKQTCKYCGKIVAKKDDSRENFCNQKCRRAYEEQEHKKNMPKPTPKTKKLYTNCIECDEPKTTERQKECKLCYSCYLSSRS